MNSEFRLMPEQASSIAGDIDALYSFLVIVSGIVSILIAALILYFAIKYRRGSPADRSAGHSHFFFLELTWSLIPLVVSMVIFFWGARLYFVQSFPPANAMEVDCVGRQWMLKFQHPEGNAEINDLHVPLNQPVKIRLISEDVIHSMYIPAFRVKHDVLPGRYTHVWFTATKPGKYHLFCAEYCGAKHSEMRGYVHVMEPADYQNWLSGAATGVSAAEAGKLLFEQMRCNNCHQGGGVTSRGPALENLFGSSVKLKDGGTALADENYLRESILRPNAKVVAGYESIMPSFEGQISEEGILHLLAYIKSLSQTKGQTTPIPPVDSDAQPESRPATDEREKGTSLE